MYEWKRIEQRIIHLTQGYCRTAAASWWNLILTSYFRNTDNKAKQEELKMKKVSLMSQMGEKYFKTESDQCLPLANQVIVYLYAIDFVLKAITLK